MLGESSAVSIEAGCNGIEAAIVLIAAMLAFPAAWKHRLVGILARFLAVQLLNIVRVISLFYLGQWSMIAFEWEHLYLWQALIMLDVLIICLVWIRMLPSTPNASYPAADDNAQPTTTMTLCGIATASPPTGLLIDEDRIVAAAYVVSPVACVCVTLISQASYRTFF